ncbi:MAG: single-stranded DNA-binding protein [Eggerthella sp.]|nr:single-stranded DNA-binding protein [Eggerthella sp.]
MAGETILTIVGNLTADPELRTTGTGTQVCGFTIASTPRVWNRQANQYEDGQSLFMRCSAWRDLAGHCAQSLSKGMRVIATGRFSQRSYQAQDGTNRTVVEMTVDEIGPSLRYATAQVTKQGGHDGCQGGSTYGNPAGNPPVGPRPAAAPSQPPASDPWANGGSGYTTDTSTTDTGDPEF